MTEHEIKNISEVQQEIQDLLAEYDGLSDEEMEDAAARIVNILIDALDEQNEDYPQGYSHGG